MTMGDTTPRDTQHSTRDNLREVQHRPARVMEPAALRRSYGFCRSHMMDDLCRSINIISMKTDTEPNTPLNVGIRNDFDTTVDCDGDSLLHLAIILNQPYVAMTIISNAPSQSYLSVQNTLFQAPLHLSAITNQSEVCRMLLTAGAEVESRDKDGNTALHIACRDGMLSIVDCLVGSSKCTGNNVGILKRVSKVHDLSIRNYSGHTYLHLAAMNGHIDTVETLVEHGADINIADGKAGRKVLHDACIRGDIRLVKTLLKYRSCNINARAYDDSTPFDFARDRCHDRVCRTLAAAGAKQNDSFTDSE